LIASVDVGGSTTDNAMAGIRLHGEPT